MILWVPSQESSRVCSAGMPTKTGHSTWKRCQGHHQCPGEILDSDEDDIENNCEDISSEAGITEDPWDWDINLESTLLLNAVSAFEEAQDKDTVMVQTKGPSAEPVGDGVWSELEFN
jgi:hypothetical protein